MRRSNSGGSRVNANILRSNLSAPVWPLLKRCDPSRQSIASRSQKTDNPPRSVVLSFDLSHLIGTGLESASNRCVAAFRSALGAIWPTGSSTALANYLATVAEAMTRSTKSL